MFKNYNTNTAYIDLLFNTLLGFVVLFIVAFLNMALEKNEPSPQLKAEFLITMTWNHEFNDDIDLWVEDPNGELVWYSSKSNGWMHLDRDDLGHSTDTIQTPTGPITLNQNIEIVTIRKAIKGEYIINVHAFSKRQPNPTIVNIKIEKLNPYSITYVKDIILTYSGQEETALRMKLNENSDVIDINFLPKRFVGIRGQRNAE